MGVNRQATLGVGIVYSIDKGSLNQVLKDLSRISEMYGGGDAPKSLLEAKKTATDLRQILTSSWNTKLGQLDLTKFTKEMKKANLSVDTIKNNLSGVENLGPKAFKSFAKEILNTNVYIKESSKLLDSLAVSMGNTIKWGATSSVLNTLTGALQKSWNYSVKLDTALNDIRIVTGKSADEMERFAQTANKAAKNLGASTQDYTEAALIYYQQGLSDQEVEARTNITLKTANVTGQTGSEVSEQLTAVWNGYKVSAEEAEKYIDKLAAVAASTASDLEELTTGMGKVASAANLMGVDIDQLNAQLATIVSVTRQAPESVGVALKTIYARMGDIEAGLSEDISLGTYTAQMKEMGINVIDAKGHLRDMGEVIEEIGNKWGSYSREQQVALSQIMAGTRQYNNLLSLFDNWDMYEDAMEVSKNSLGTLSEQQAIYLDSVQAHIEKLQTEAEKTYDILFDEDMAKGFFTAVTSGLELINSYLKGIGSGWRRTSSLLLTGAQVFSTQLGRGIEKRVENKQLAQANRDADKLKANLARQHMLNGKEIDNYDSLDLEVHYTQKLLKLRDHITASKEKDLINQQQELTVLVDMLEKVKSYQTIANQLYSNKFHQQNPQEQLDADWFLEARKNVEDAKEKILRVFDSNFYKGEDYRLPIVSSLKTSFSQDKGLGTRRTNYIENLKQTGQYSNIDIAKMQDSAVPFNTEKYNHESLTQSEQGALKQFQYRKDILTSYRDQLKLQATSNTATEEQIQKYIKMSNIVFKMNNLKKLDEEDLMAIEDAKIELNKQYNNQIKLAQEGYEGILGAQEYTEEGLEEEKKARVDILDTQYQQLENAKKYGDAIRGGTTFLNVLLQGWGMVSTMYDETISATEKVNQLSSVAASIVMQLVLNLRSVGSFFAQLPSLLGKAIKGVGKFVQSLFQGNIKLTLILAAVTAIVLAFKALYESSLKHEKTLEKMQAAYDSLNQKASETKDTINGIQDAAGKYYDLVTALAKCTEGTTEWKDALEAVNDQAIEIIDQYPSLLKYGDILTRTANGMLVLDDDKVRQYTDSLETFYDLQKSSGILLSALKNQEAASFNTESLREEINNKWKGIGHRIDRPSRIYDPNADYYDTSSYTNRGDKVPGQYETIPTTKNTYLDNILGSDADLLSLAGKTDAEFEAALRSLAQSALNAGDVTQDEVDEWVEHMKTYQGEIDNLAEETSNAATTIKNAAKLIAEEIADEDATNTEKSIIANKYSKTWEDTYNAKYGKMTGDKINKASGADNKIYKDIMGELNLATGGKYRAIEKGNAVIGTDGNRKFVVLDENNKRVELTAEEIAGLLADSKASEESNKDWSTDAEAILNSVTGNLGGTITQDIADKMLDSNFDVNQLTQEEYDAIMKNIDPTTGKFTNQSFITDAQAQEMGYKSAAELIGAIETELKDWDAQEAANNIKDNWEASIAGGASAVDVSTDSFRAYSEQLADNNRLLDINDEKTIESSKAHFKLSQAIDSLHEGVNDNEDLLRKWASGAEISNNEMETLAPTIKAIKEALNMKVSDEFVRDHMDQILKLANGDISVLDELQKAATQEFVLGEFNVDSLADLPADVKSMVDFINNMDLPSIELGATLDSTGLTTILTQLLDSCAITADQANTILKAIGFEPKVTMQSVDYTASTTGNSTEYTYTDPVTGTQKTVSAENATITEGKLQVPVINGKDIHYVGGNENNFTWSPPKKKGTTKKPKKEDLIEDEHDRYHDVNIKLKQIANALEKVKEETGYLMGDELIKNLQLQYNLLNQEIETTTEKMEIAKDEMQELQQKLSGKGVQFNADGTIANYEEAYHNQLAYVNGVIAHYNSLSADAQEAYQDTLDKAKEDWEKFLEDIDRYDEVVTEFIPELEADIRDALAQQIELKLEAFEYDIKIRLDLAQAERDWNEFKKRIIDGIKDDDILGNAKANLQDFYSYYNDQNTGEIQATTTHINKILEQLRQMDADQTAGIYGETYSYVDMLGKTVTIDFNNRKQALEDLKEYYTKLMDSMNDLQDRIEEIHESYMAMMDEAQEKFDKQKATYDSINDTINHKMNLTSLVLGEDAYDVLADFYEEQEENNKKQLEFQTQQIDFWRQQMLSAEEGSEEWENAREKWETAIADWKTMSEQSIQGIIDKYTNGVNLIFKNLNDKVTGGVGLNYASKEWELMNKEADRYLDTINGIYQTQTLQNKYLDAIEQSTDPATQKKLNDLMEDELALLREKDKLSQYDIDRANMKYDIAMKQIALEEAQQNKTQLRLRRDSQGNYRYQYTADESEISKLQQELSDLYNQLYNLDAGKYKENLDELYQVWEQFNQDMLEASKINDPEEKARQELLIKERYGNIINDIVADNEAIQKNLHESTLSELLDLYDQNKDNYEQMTAEQTAILDKFLNIDTANLSGAAYDNLFNIYNENTAAFEKMTQDQLDILTASFLPQFKSEYQQMADFIRGEGGFVPTCQEAFDQLTVLGEEYLATLNNAYAQYKQKADEVQLETQDLLKDNTQLYESYKLQLEAVKAVIDELDKLVLAYNDAAEAAKKAAIEAKAYWTAVQNENANTDTTIKDEGIKPKDKPDEAKKKDPSTSAPSLSIGSTVSVKPGTKWYANSYGGGSWGYATGGKIAYINTAGTHAYNIGGSGWIKKTDIVGYDTGGYTGEWNSTNGKLAMLHQKELVLNENDTKNILNAVEILRGITRSLGQTLMNQMASISANNTAAIANAVGNDILEQSVHIDAQFPNVTNSNEIETALNNLVNMASQHIQKN